jgi:hypothetical protein
LVSSKAVILKLVRLVKIIIMKRTEVNKPELLKHNDL